MTLTTSRIYLPSTAARVDNGPVWLLVAVPAILLVCIDALFWFTGLPGSLWGAIVALTANTVIVVWDSRYLKSRGIEIGASLGILVAPAYLVQRSIKTRQNHVPLVVWIATFVFGIAGSVGLASHFVQLNMNKVESGVSTWVDKTLTAGAVVTCPARSVYPVGSTFLCTASDATFSANIAVSVDSGGLVTWRLISTEVARPSGPVVLV